MSRQRYQYQEELKHFPLPVGFIVISGEQGAGKTSLATALLSLDYKYHGKERIRAAQAHTAALNRMGYTLELPQHLYFSNVELSLTKPLADRRAIRTHHITVGNFGLPNEDYEVQYFPRGSVVFISEADIWLYCQNYQQVSKYVWNLIKYVRHNRMTVIFDVQVFDRLPIQLRKLCTDLIYIYGSSYTPPRIFGLIKQRTLWTYNWSKPQQHAAMKELIEIGAKVKKRKLEHNGACMYKGNVYGQYDSYSGEMYFLCGITEHGYGVQSHPARDYTPSGVSQYCAALPLTSPKEEK